MSAATVGLVKVRASPINGCEWAALTYTPRRTAYSGESAVRFNWWRLDGKLSVRRRRTRCATVVECLARWKEPENLVQETFLRTWRRRATYRGDSSSGRGSTAPRLGLARDGTGSTPRSASSQPSVRGPHRG